MPGDVSKYVTILAVFYILSLVASFAYSRMMAIITQGSLDEAACADVRRDATLPVKYFDTPNHGEIMTHYTNDIDTLRQLISQSLPQLLVSAIVISTVLFIMLYYCVWLTLVVIAGVCVMLLVTKKIGGRSARHFVRQQQALGKEEGYIEEIMNGQKVVKVFCHEEACQSGFRPYQREPFCRIGERKQICQYTRADPQ